MAKTCKSPRRLAIGLLLILALQSCEAEVIGPSALGNSNVPLDSVIVEPLLYLEEVIPPCVPVENSMIEPCLIGPPPQVSNITVHLTMYCRTLSKLLLRTL